MTTDILKARIEDTASIAVRTNRPKLLGFLSLDQAAFSRSILSKINVEFSFYGGYENAERVILCCYPNWCENLDFNIRAITLTYRKGDLLSHRDFLGSLMSLGIERDAVGDILCEEGRAVIFLTREIAPFVKEQLTKVGRVGVTVNEGCTEPLPMAPRLTEQSDIIASERLDCVVAALASCSRNGAAEKIAAGLVTVNSVTCEKSTKLICGGDVICIRGKGKFIIDSLNDKTKKSRLVLKYKKYV